MRWRNNHLLILLRNRSDTKSPFAFPPHVVELVVNRYSGWRRRHLQSKSEPFGTRIESFFIALCVAIGDLDGRPFSVSKIASYMRVPRATVMRRLERLQWGLVRRHGHHYFMQPKTLNSLIGLQNYQKTRCKLKRAMDELSILDTQTD